MDKAGAGVFEGEETTRKVRMGVAFQVKCDRFGPALHPDRATHDTFCAVVDFAADYVVMNSEGHLRQRGYGKRADLVDSIVNIDHKPRCTARRSNKCR